MWLNHSQTASALASPFKHQRPPEWCQNGLSPPTCFPQRMAGVTWLYFFGWTEVNTLPRSPWPQQEFDCFSAAVSHGECSEEKGARVKGEGFTIIQSEEARHSVVVVGGGLLSSPLLGLQACSWQVVLYVDVGLLAASRRFAWVPWPEAALSSLPIRTASFAQAQVRPAVGGQKWVLKFDRGPGPGAGSDPPLRRTNISLDM